MNKCDRVAGTVYRMDGILGAYLKAVSQQWLQIAPLANPAMLEMFRDRDRKPLRNMVPWAGEFAGKYLTSAVQVLRLSDDPELREFIATFVAELVELQGENGYLGPWPAENALANLAPNSAHKGVTWDTWGHYHIMLGLLLWYEDYGDPKALDCVRRMGDLLCEMYLGEKSPRLAETPWTEMNLAPAHSLALLYKVTGERRYLELAEQIVEEFAALDSEGKPLAGNYLNGPLAGLEFFELPKPRWESLHPIMALSELYSITGKEEYRDAFERIWRSIAETDRHNTGGFSSSEKANGNPYDPGAIETCCTIAWIALGVEMLRLTGDSTVADELEFSTLNSVTGMHAVSGRWVTYDTPADGERVAFTQHTSQARAGSPELNCCSVNGARGFGMVSDWALVRDGQGLLLNWYGPSKMTARLNNGVEVTLEQKTDYPCGGRIELTISPAEATAFCLKLRIPRWSTSTTVKLNGSEIAGCEPGSYLAIERQWESGDKIEIELDMALHFWTGEEEMAGKTSIYYGPILLTYDCRYNEMAPEEVPVLDARDLAFEKVEWRHWLPPMLLLEFSLAEGRKVRLCDFGSAGEGGTPYKSWLDVKHVDMERPQFFAPSENERLHAEIARQAVMYAWYPTAGPERRPTLLKLTQRWPQFLDNCAKARAMIEKDPESEVSRSLAKLLARIESDWDFMDPGIPDRLAREFVQGELEVLGDIRVSQLLPAVPDIRQVELPDETAKFSPVYPQNPDHWFDLNAAHGGRDGVLYLRATVNMPKATDVQLLYGADGPIKVWVNDREVGCEPEATNPAAAREYRIPAVHWQKGENSLVFALGTNHGKAWGMHMSAPQS